MRKFYLEQAKLSQVKFIMSATGSNNFFWKEDLKYEIKSPNKYS